MVDPLPKAVRHGKVDWSTDKFNSASPGSFPDFIIEPPPDHQSGLHGAQVGISGQVIASQIKCN